MIPSRDEPFGLVAVEFGRKGALGIGARVGGLGNMPGWWFTVESTSPTHLLAQFESAIKEALSSTKKERAQMRATSARQRFPVQVWVKQLEKLQQGAKKFARPTTAMGSVDIQAIHDSIMLEAGPLPGTPDSINASIASFLVPPHYSLGMSMPNESTNTLSRLSMASVTSERSDFALTKFNATFTDEDGEYSRQFVRDLENIDPKSSKADLCIESYLIKSEKKWFNEVRMSKLGLGSTNSSTATLVHYHDGAQSPMVESGMSLQEISLDGSQYLSSPSEFPPMGIKLLLLRKIGDWPIYTFLLAIVCISLTC